MLFTSASTLLTDLAERDTAWARQQRLRRYVRPQLLVIDEVGYLSYDNRHADLLFEVITRRYERPATSTIITTNKPFTQWNDVFPSAACVVTLIDRLTHRSELVQIDADSYRLKEAKQRATEKATRRRASRSSCGACAGACCTAKSRAGSYCGPGACCGISTSAGPCGTSTGCSFDVRAPLKTVEKMFQKRS